MARLGPSELAQELDESRFRSETCNSSSARKGFEHRSRSIAARLISGDYSEGRVEELNPVSRPRRGRPSKA